MRTLHQPLELKLHHHYATNNQLYMLPFDLPLFHWVQDSAKFSASRLFFLFFSARYTSNLSQFYIDGKHIVLKHESNGKYKCMYPNFLWTYPSICAL